MILGVTNGPNEYNCHILIEDLVLDVEGKYNFVYKASIEQFSIMCLLGKFIPVLS